MQPLSGSVTFNWSDPEARQFFDLLLRSYTDPAAINTLYQMSAPALAPLNLAQPTARIWFEALNNLALSGHLKDFFQVLLKRNSSVQLRSSVMILLRQEPVNEIKLRQLQARISRVETRDTDLASELSVLKLRPEPSSVSMEAVLRVGRPVIPVMNDQPQIESPATESDTWQKRLATANSTLRSVMASIGRIDINNHPVLDWAGTGWIVENGIIVTTRYVANLFAAAEGSEFRFQTGIEGRSINCFIDMKQEAVDYVGEVFHITRVLYIEPEPGPDIAFLAIEDDARKPIPLSLETNVNEQANVALIGYPARDTRAPDLELMERIFNIVYGKKHLAPGKITNAFNDRINHDCSAVGTWSGAALVDIATGKVIGLQYGGRFLDYNYAIPASVIASALSRAKERMTAAISSIQLQSRDRRDPSKDIIRYKSFQEGLGNANLSVALIRDPDTKTGICNGWLITETLVVVPDYSQSIPRQSRLECYFFNAKNQLVVSAAKLVHGSKTKDEIPVNDLKPALLRLEKPVSGAAAMLNMNSLGDTSYFYRLYYPFAKPPLELSVSQFTSKTDRILEYPAVSVPGSGGAPLFSFDGKVIGMHYAATEQMAMAFSIRAILADLQQSPDWNEIARFHNLPEIKSKKEIQQAKAKADKEAKQRQQLLSKYAVRWSINPKTIGAATKKLLSQYVIDSDDTSKWILEDEIRRRVIQNMGSLRQLRAARGKMKINDAGQQVIDEILKGKPFKVEKISENDLPYWLQAIAWFEGVVPGLPTRQAISKELQRRRHRSRLIRSAGPEFRGRTEELEILANWYKSPETGAMIVSGIGGIGKSALISKFALELDKGTILFWLDFDRADIAPDNAMSVLRIMIEQLSFQANDYMAPDVNTKDWEAVADNLGAQMQIQIDARKPALVVLDGFEVAQHSRKYNQMWPLLERLLTKAPAMKVIVSGRSRVENLKLNSNDSQYIELTGLEKEEAKNWLVKHGIKTKTLIDRTYRISRGIPLVLKLAARFIDEGGKMAELPDKLPQVMIEGFLYQRICNRVINQKLRNVVKDILVLRVISPEIIEEILPDNLPAKMTAQEVFASILREMSLVPEVEFITDNSATESSVTIVNIRPEVRAASLRLLEMQDGERVRTIDMRAIQFYKKKKKPGKEEKIELIYHYLRTGNLAKAQQLWQHEYISALEGSVEDIPEKYVVARDWLRSKTGNAPLEMELKDWEEDAYNRIKRLNARGHFEAIPGILNERKERTENSRLVIYDADVLWRDYELADEALLKLNAAEKYRDTVSPHVFYERQVVAAKIAFQYGDEALSKKILHSLREAVKGNVRFIIRPINLVSISPRIMFAAKQALKKEIELLELLLRRGHGTYGLVEKLQLVMPFSDFILPQLQALSRSFKKTAAYQLILPEDSHAKSLFMTALGHMRQTEGISLDGMQQSLGSTTYNQEAVNHIIRGRVRDYAKTLKAEREFQLAGEISMLAWERWHLALTGLWFNGVMRYARAERTPDFRLAFAVTPAYASFRGVSILSKQNIIDLPKFSSTDKFVEFMMRKFLRKLGNTPVHISDEARRLAVQYLELIKNKGLVQYKEALIKGASYSPGGVSNFSIDELLAVDDPGIRTVLFMLLMPNSIEVIGNEILGLPHVFANEDYFIRKRFS